MSRRGASGKGHGVAWLIAGTAGEGLESGGDTFARALAASGYRPTTQRDFPSRIRGGDTTFTVRLTAEGRLAPPGRIDLALAFNDTVLPRIDARMGAGSLLLVDEGKVGSFVAASGCMVEAFPFTALATAAGLAKAKNMVALGASAALLGVDLDALARSVDEQFRSKGDKVVQLNRQALRSGHDEAVRRYGAEPRLKAPAPSGGAALFLSGNEAASLGALAAGCRIAAAYPITPASDILEYLTPRLQLLGGTALQMEDELAAVNVLIGAGFTGAKALTATSGPGLSLMTEALGFAGSAEVPIVVIDCQRPGPSTGMPTKHGQEDLWHLVHGGHGEHVRIVLAPTDVADAFHATAEAFRLAERFRAPAFVALDQQASLFRQTVAPFDLESAAREQGTRGANALPPSANAWDHSYNAYFGDGSEHPVRVALPGEPGGRHYSNSTEHAPSGFTNEDPKIRADMVARRLRRMQAIVAEARHPVVIDDGEAGTDKAGTSSHDIDVVLLSWGSTVEACREAADRLRANGRTARVVGIRLLWPFPREAVAAALGHSLTAPATSQTASPILCVEANGFGQLARLVKSELPVHDRLRSLAISDGRPIPSDAILDALEETP